MVIPMKYRFRRNDKIFRIPAGDEKSGSALETRSASFLAWLGMTVESRPVSSGKGIVLWHLTP